MRRERLQDKGALPMKKRSLFASRQVYAYTALSTLLIILFMTISYRYIANTSRQLAILNQNEFANKELAQVESYLGELDDVSYRIMTNPRLLNLFNQLQQQPQSGNYFDTNILVNIDTGSLLGTIKGPQSMVWRIGVYNQYGDYIRAGALEDKRTRTRLLQTENVTAEMQALSALPDKMEILPPAQDRWSEYYSAQYVTVKRPLMNIYSQEVYGVVEIQQDTTRLRTLMQFDTLRNIDVSVADSGGAQVLSLQNSPQNARRLYSVTRTSDQYGWSVTLTQSEQAMIAPYLPLLRFAVLGSFGLIVLMATLIALIAHRLSAPLVALKDTVAGITYTGGVPQPLKGSESLDEVRELSTAFDAMLNRIGDSVALEKKAMLLALQSQMNPHFFHNIMTVISAAGMEGKDEQVVRMCGQVCAMLRYTSSFEEKVITVKDELEHVTTYLELMKARYEEYFNYDVAVDERALGLPMPRLVLQPLAENCFEHGFGEQEPPYYIRIDIQFAQGGWRILVSDNGCGMTPEAKTALMQKIDRYAGDLSGSYRELKLGGLGLVNTALRLRCSSVRPATLSLQDYAPHGTTVVIQEELP